MHMPVQLPQCCGSELRIAQVAPHIIAPVGQVHWPLTHCEPGWQSWPQPPQLLGSDDGSTHEAPHGIWPWVEQVHAPPVQVAPFGQAWPHDPQCAALDDRSAQMLPGQATPGDGQVALQMPTVQKGVAAPQMCPQLPQLFGSLLGSTQKVPHCVVPPGHPPIRQSPLTHELPAWQAWPQSPQCCPSVRISVHAPLQFIKLAGQAATQTPPAQLAVAPPQAVAQFPQCAGSSSRLTVD
jgi:hypothetical protein